MSGLFLFEAVNENRLCYWDWLPDSFHVFRQRCGIGIFEKNGIKNANKSIGKLYYLLNHLRVFPQIKGKGMVTGKDG